MILMNIIVHVLSLYSISALSMDCAVNRSTEAGLASAVEGCICPEGYKVSIFNLY